MEESFETLYRDLKSSVARLAYYYLQDSHAAEDLLQEVFSELYEILKHRGLKEIQNPKAYTLRMARNRSLDFLRKKKSLREQDMESVGALAFSAREDGDPELGRELLAAFEKLGGNQREVMTLKIFHGLDLTEIAEVTGHPRGTISSWYTRALAELRLILRLTD